MKVEIVIQCIDDGRVPKHQIQVWTIRGDTSRDVRMRRLGNVIAKAIKQEFTKP